MTHDVQRPQKVVHGLEHHAFSTAVRLVHAVLLEVVDGPQLVTLLDSEPSDRQPRLMLCKDVLDCVGAIEPALFCSLFLRDCKQLATVGTLRFCSNPR